jgi:hypothetical protein
MSFIAMKSHKCEKLRDTPPRVVDGHLNSLIMECIE